MNTLQRAELFEIRRLLDVFISGITESPKLVNESVTAIRQWKPGPSKKDDIRKHLGIPYRCISDHDSTGNETWSPDLTPALWMQYHGTSKETARPWLRPTGAHDIYRSGEWMIWSDGMVWPCLMDTNFSPSEYPSAWGSPESIE